MVNAVPKELENSGPGLALAECLSRAKLAKPDDICLKRIQIEAPRNPLSTQVVLHTKDEVRPGNEEITLRILSNAVQPAIQMHQQSHTVGGKLRIEIQTPNATLVPAPTGGNRLLSRRELKKLEIELKSDLGRIGVNNFVLTMYSLSLNGKWSNLIGVQGDFNFSHIPYLRKIHDRYKPKIGSQAYNRIIEEGGFFADIKFTVKRIAPEVNIGRVRGSLLTGTRSQLVIHRQMNHFLDANIGQVHDWRRLRMMSLDDKNTERPEDLTFVRSNANGTMTVYMAAPFTLCNPMSGTSTKYFEKGVDTLAIGLITTLSPDKRASVGRAALVVVRERDRISWEKAEKILKGDYSSPGFEASPEEIKNIQTMNIATKLSAARSISIGASVENIFQDPTKRENFEICPSDMVTELIVTNQRALALYLAAQEVPLLIKRATPKYTHLKSEFRKIFGEMSSAWFSLLGTSKEATLFETLSKEGRPDIIREIASSKILAQRENTPIHVAIARKSQLKELDRAPFKSRHGTIPALINQLQLAAFATDSEPFTYEDLYIMAAKLNENKDNAQEIIKSPLVINKKAMISDALYSSVVL